MASIGSTLPLEFAVGHSRIEIFLSARDLQKLDITSNTDAFAIISIIYSDGSKETIGRTEVIYDTQNPEFNTQIAIDYFFEELQTIEVVLYDEDVKGSTNLADHDYIGETTFTLGALMGAKSQSLCIPLTKKGKNGNHGKLIVKGEESVFCTEFLYLGMRAQGLANKDGLFGKSDPFFKVLRSREDGTWIPVFTSNYVKNNLNPTWDRQTMNIGTVCNGDYERPLRIEIWDFESDGRHQSMGKFDTCLREIAECAGTDREFPVIEEDKKKKKKNYLNSGVIKIIRADIRREISFLDFVKGGCTINMIVAIDFTASNGHPFRADSLHRFDPTGQTLNHYQQAILSIGAIVRDYDTDKRFPVYGFGGKIANQVSHCFPLHGPEGSVYEVPGIMAAYQNALAHIELSGPTLFSPIISQTMRQVFGQCSQQSQSYTVLLIITDGVINDMTQTIDTIVEASAFPMSIIIVGVGNADFAAMNELDCDDGFLISTTGKKALRDIVQFVPFRQYSNQHFSKLAKDTLIEVPGQLVSYMHQNNIVPNPPVVFDINIVASAPYFPDTAELPTYQQAVGK